VALGDHLERPEETELHELIVPEPRTPHKTPPLYRRSTAARPASRTLAASESDDLEAVHT
jgi:hypothetical protein